MNPAIEPTASTAHHPAPILYLASRSPRRRDLLAQLGVGCELLLDDDEARAEALEAGRPGERPADYVQRVARAKTLAAFERLQAGDRPHAPVLGADTTVAIGETVLGKPLDAADARRMLDRLQGRVHRVYTAVVLALPAPATDAVRLHAVLQASRVRFRRLKADEMDRYVASGEPFGKAGGYAIQGLAASFVRRIDGSHSGIMGLPLFETARLLRKAGIVVP